MWGFGFLGNWTEVIFLCWDGGFGLLGLSEPGQVEGLGLWEMGVVWGWWVGVFDIFGLVQVSRRLDFESLLGQRRVDWLYRPLIFIAEKVSILTVSLNISVFMILFLLEIIFRLIVAVHWKVILVWGVNQSLKQFGLVRGFGTRLAWGFEHSIEGENFIKDG